MRLFDTNVQELKYKVIREVVRLASRGELESHIHEIPKTIVPGPKPTMRCCIYHERAIVEERVQMAMGGNPDNPNVVEVVDIACDECPVHRFSVTEACRGCIAHRCSSNCPRGAISFVNQKAVIDHTRCIECGKCMRSCPYNAIIECQRPCVKSCRAGAISVDEQKKARIDNNKCTHCGSCVYACPFGAIVDKSYVLDVLRILKESEGGKKYRVYAAIAPAIVSQFNYARIGQVVSGIKNIGFQDVVEVALGADMVALKEAGELAEKGFLTSSCCPAFVRYLQINFPALADKVSSNVSPMVELARLIKHTDPGARVIFIGPCIAKKGEILKPELKGEVDSVLTFEELQAMFDGLGIQVETLPDSELDNASYYGRIFARSGGVATSVAHVLETDHPDFQLHAEVCSGLDQCKVALLKASKHIGNTNFIEGMGCEGGCMNGAACLHHGPKNQSDIDNFGKQAMEKSIHDSVKVYEYAAGHPSQKD